MHLSEAQRTLARIGRRFWYWYLFEVSIVALSVIWRSPITAMDGMVRTVRGQLCRFRSEHMHDSVFTRKALIMEARKLKVKDPPQGDTVAVSRAVLANILDFVSRLQAQLSDVVSHIDVGKTESGTPRVKAAPTASDKPRFISRTAWEAMEVSTMLDAVAVAKLLHLSSPNQVRERLKARKLIGVLPVGRERGALYPAWQFEPRMLSNLEGLIQHFRDDEPMWSLYEFFEEPNAMLHGLSPHEVFVGKAAHEDKRSPKAIALLRSDPYRRCAQLLLAIGEFSETP
jgi:hypothetical protein